MHLLEEKLTKSVLLCAAAALFLSQFAIAQTFTSSITGVVSDPSAASVAGANVELKNLGTNDVRDFTSQNDGAFQFNNLQPGTYELTVTSRGFKTFVQSNLILQANVNTTVNVPLEVGGTQQKVEVTASAVLLDTETANNTVTMDNHLIESLPNNTRNPLNFVFAVAGTTPAPSGSGQTNNYNTLDQQSSNFGINGGRTGEAEILIDGAPSQAVDWGGLMVSPLQDSIQEQQIVQNTYDSQYERGGGGIVMLITKGGTNQFHGEAYDYLQNSALDANSWTNNKNGAPKGQFKQNQFGGNISGPLLKRWNLFFFGGYEGLRQPNTQNSGLLTVPTQAERAGDFSAALNADGTPDLIYNPFSTTALDNTGSNYTRTQFPNNKIPSNLINPVGQKIVNLYPLPNRPGVGPNDLNNYYAQGAGNQLNDKMDTRVDWEQSSNHRMFVRWSDRFRQDQVVPCYFCNGADTGLNQGNNGFQVVLNDTITPSPRWVIDTYVSYSRWKETHLAQGLGIASPATIGLSPSLFQSPALPTISGDNGYASLGNSSDYGYVRYSDTAQMNITKVFNRHTLKFGGNFDVQQINVFNEAVGNFNFNSGLTSCDPNPGGPCLAQMNTSIESGNSIASMLLGTGSGGGQAINLDSAQTLHTFGAYVQDQWRVNPRLTVNIGVRYENQRPATERYNRITYFDLGVTNPITTQVSPLYNQTLTQIFGHPLTGGFEYPGVDGNDRYQWSPNNHDFAPRAGIAYKITDKLVARMGAGIFFLPPSALIGDDGGQSIGFTANTPYNATQDNGFVPLSLVSNPFPESINQPTGSSQGLLTLVGGGINGIWPKGSHPTSYAEDWSFDLQYQLSSHSVFEIGYNGNRGKKLLYGNINLDADQMPGQFLSLGPQLDQQVPNPFYGLVNPSYYLGQVQTIAYNELLRPYPQFTNLQWTRSLPGARSAFDALNVKYNHEFSAGLSLLMTYQWSKALDDGPEDYFGWATNATEWRDAYHTNLDYNISTHDIPQSFAAALVYDLPYGSGKRWGSSAPRVVKETLGNWQLSSVIRLSSGLPANGIPNSFVITGNYNQLANYGFPGSNQLADLVGNPIPANQGPNNWINPNAFATPQSIYVLGNEPLRMTQLRERAFRNVDLAIAKNFGGERFQAWLRGEFLNAFNYAQYNNFCMDLSQASCFPFGEAFGTENTPRTIQVSLKLMF